MAHTWSFQPWYVQGARHRRTLVPLMLTTAPAWVHTRTGASTTMVSKKTRSAADTTPKGCFTLEQAAAQGQATGKQPSLLPTAQAAPRQIDYTSIKEDDRSPSKLREQIKSLLFPGFIPRSYPITPGVIGQGPRQTTQLMGHSPCLLPLSRSRFGPSAETLEPKSLATVMRS